MRKLGISGIVEEGCKRKYTRANLTKAGGSPRQLCRPSLHDSKIQITTLVLGRRTLSEPCMDKEAPVFCIVEAEKEKPMANISLYLGPVSIPAATI